jgi:CubicO group peptidase (beta-lactamase class C family)
MAQRFVYRSLPRTALSLFTYHYISTCDDNYSPSYKLSQEAKEGIDKIYSDSLKKNHLPSVIYGLMKDGKLIYSNSSGQIDPLDSNSSSPNLHSKYRIASMSKSFTAMAILQLRDHGYLSLSDPVHKYLPELSHTNFTIWNLLIMESGLPQDDPWADRLLNQSREDFSLLIQQKFFYSNPIGITFEYSNLNYAILGEIISRVSGMKYQKYIEEKILKPLDMRETVFDYTEGEREGEEKGKNLVKGFRWEENQWKSEPYLGDGVFGAMGGIITTMNDYVKYAAYHQSVWPIEGREDPDLGMGVKTESSQRHQPLRPSSLREMHQLYSHAGIMITPPPSPPSSTSGAPPSSPPVATCAGYGLGLMIWHDTRNVKTVRHAGGLPGLSSSFPLSHPCLSSAGFGSEWRFLPEYGIAVISFANRTYAPMMTTTSEVVNYLIDNKLIERKDLKPSQILQHRGEQLIQWLHHHSPLNEPTSVLEDEIFAINFFLDSEKRLRRKEFDEVVRQLNGIVMIGKVQAMNNLRGTMILTGENGRKGKIYFTMTPENMPKIQTLQITVLDPGS